MLAGQLLGEMKEAGQNMKNMLSYRYQEGARLQMEWDPAQLRDLEGVPASLSEMGQNFTSKKGKIIIKAEDAYVIFISVVKVIMTPEVEAQLDVKVEVDSLENSETLNRALTKPGIVMNNSPDWIGGYGEVTGRIEAEDHSTTHFKADLGLIESAVMSLEAPHAVFEPFIDLESYSSDERVTLEGGGGHGGKRENTGRKCDKSN